MEGSHEGNCDRFQKATGKMLSAHETTFPITIKNAENAD
jgi:hypothetical protein